VWCCALGQRVSDPLVVVNPADFNLRHGIEHHPDGSITTIRQGERQYWLTPLWNKTEGGIDHVKTEGPPGHPFAKVLWVKTQPQFFRYEHRGFIGNFWIVNTWQDRRGVLAFLHIENADGSGHEPRTGKYLNEGRSRVGLAWSEDYGESFTYLGPIIVPAGDPDPHNVQGVPYIVRDGYFIIYFHDSNGITAARAPVEEVIAAAQAGRTSPWKKYAGPEAGFVADGLGGRARRIGIDGISHGDGACSTYTGKCYLLLTRMNWEGKDTWIRLFESSDGVRWALRTTLAQQPATPEVAGFQYASIMPLAGYDDGSVGERFLVYSDKDYPSPGRATWRWEIDLGGAARP
jgi:hypothetical protein